MNNETRINAIIQALTEQRNNAMNEVVALRVKVAELEQTIIETKKESEKTTKDTTTVEQPVKGNNP
jgi:predicted  nucleic acid-binding Zn-ribbon protein